MAVVVRKVYDTPFTTTKTGISLMSLPPCPKCSSEYVYEDQNQLICPECAYEWDPNAIDEEDAIQVKDATAHFWQTAIK